MDNPGCFQLTTQGAAFQLGAAAVVIGDIVRDLAGMRSVALQASFKYGSGGTSVTAYVQTSLDQGQSWIDICAFEFTTSGGTLVANLDTDASVVPISPPSQNLTPGDLFNAVLGDRLRAVVISVGIYVQSQLNLTGVAR
jgi:hypothetical protein